MDDIIIIEFFLQLMLSLVTLTPRTPAYPSQDTPKKPHRIQSSRSRHQKFPPRAPLSQQKAENQPTGQNYDAGIPKYWLKWWFWLKLAYKSKFRVPNATTTTNQTVNNPLPNRKAPQKTNPKSPPTKPNPAQPPESTPAEAH